MTTTLGPPTFDPRSERMLKRLGTKSWATRLLLSAETAVCVYTAATAPLLVAVIAGTVAAIIVASVLVSPWIGRAVMRQMKIDMLAVSRIRALCREPSPLDVRALVASDHTIDRRSFESGMRNMAHLISETIERTAADVDAL